MLTKRANRTIGAALFGLATVTMPLATAGAAQAHGFTQNPPSRQALCADGTVSDCGAIQWEPQSVEGPGNFPQGGPADGHLCSGGNERFAVLDDPRGGKWPAAQVQAGQQLPFRWKITAAHSTESFRYYVTKNGWDPTKPLTREQLEPAPFHQVDLGGKKPGATVTHEVPLPEGKQGRHMIFAVWEIANTGSAFYSCSDVVFGGGGAEPAGEAPAATGTATDGVSGAQPDGSPVNGDAADPASSTVGGAVDAPANERNAADHGGGVWSWFSSMFG